MNDGNVFNLIRLSDLQVPVTDFDSEYYCKGFRIPDGLTNKKYHLIRVRSSQPKQFGQIGQNIQAEITVDVQLVRSSLR